MSADLIVLVAGIVVGLACVVVGAVRVLSRALPLRARVDSYRELPLLKLVGTTELRVSRAQRSMRELPALRARMMRAFAELRAARESLRTSALTVIVTVRALPSILLGQTR